MGTNSTTHDHFKYKMKNLATPFSFILIIRLPTLTVEYTIYSYLSLFVRSVMSFVCFSSSLTLDKTTIKRAPVIL